MNINLQIKNFLDDLLGDYKQTPELLEQKEELATHLSERVHDHMQTGYDFSEAFEAAVRDLGDINELVAGIAPQKARLKTDSETKNKNKKKHKKKHKRKEKESRRERIVTSIVAITPFIYLILGVAFGWWAWAWVIIPMAGVLFVGEWRTMIVSMTPFIYFLLGWFFGWWAWGWLIIPVAAVLLYVGCGGGDWDDDDRDW